MDEYESFESLMFFVRPEERKSIAGQRRLRDDRIAPLFNQVKERYPYIFPRNDTVELSERFWRT